MKNIEILMQDNFYANNLNTLLNTMFEDINSRLISNLEEKSKKSLIIVDEEIQNNISTFLYLNEERKYKNIDYIYKLIVDKYKDIELETTKQEIITFVNLSQMKSINEEATEFAKYYSKKHNTLLINFNSFGKYKPVENEISLDSLLFIIDNKKDISVNKLENLSYISSSNMPFETEKLEYVKYILDILKYQHYKKILIDLSFNISSRNIEILKNSDLIIFYNNDYSERKFIESSKSFIKNQLNHKYKEVNITKIQEEYILEINNLYFNLKNIDEVVKIYDQYK